MDRRTLFSVQAALLLFLSGVVLVAYLTQSKSRRDKGSPWFAAGYAAAGLGLLFQSYRGIIPPALSIIAGNGLFMLFSPLCNRAVARTTGQKRDYMALLIALDVATLLNYTYFTWWQPSVMVRTVEAVFVVGVMHLACVDLLLRNKDKRVQPAILAMVAAYATHMIPGFIRIFMAVRLHNADAWFSWSGIVTIAALALSYLWIGSLRSSDELERTAMTDPLTGLYNRRALDVLAAREIQHALRRDVPCTALMLDVNRFKQINDTLGHAAGDASLCAVSSTLQATLRVTDLATRLGGDEFFVLLPDCDEMQGELITARLNLAVSSLDLKTMGGESFGISVSVGRVTLQGAHLSLNDLLHGSDIMLYREKQKLTASDQPAPRPLGFATRPKGVTPMSA